jgi:hypothetical protein
MRILKTLRRVDELATKASEDERQERERREALMIRLVKSRNNNLKLFSLKVKGDNFC